MCVVWQTPKTRVPPAAELPGQGQNATSPCEALRTSGAPCTMPTMRAGRLGGGMERQRPDYLEPIPRTRWEFPWLGLWAVLLLGMAGAGIWLHLKTGDAWNTRFKGATAPSAAAAPIEPSTAEIDPSRQVPIAEIRARREQAEREILQHRAGIRCIGGIAFRRIPGGWENIPGQKCS